MNFLATILKKLRGSRTPGQCGSAANGTPAAGTGIGGGVAGSGANGGRHVVTPARSRSASLPISPEQKCDVALVGHSGLIAHGEYVERRLRDGRRLIVWETTMAALSPETKLVFKG